MTVRRGLRGAALALGVGPSLSVVVVGPSGSSSRVGCRTGIFGQEEEEDDDEALREPSPHSELSMLPKEWFGSKPLLDMTGTLLLYVSP